MGSDLLNSYLLAFLFIEQLVMLLFSQLCPFLPWFVSFSRWRAVFRQFPPGECVLHTRTRGGRLLVSYTSYAYQVMGQVMITKKLKINILYFLNYDNRCCGFYFFRFWFPSSFLNFGYWFNNISHHYLISKYLFISYLN